MDEKDVVAECPLDGIAEEFWVSTCAGGVVRVVEDEDFRAAQDVGGHGIEVGKVVVLFGKWEVVDLAAVVAGMGTEDGIAGGGHEGDVAGVDEGGRQDGKGGLGADGVDDVGVGVNVGDAADVFEEASSSVFEDVVAVVGVTTVFGLEGLGVKDVDGFAGCVGVWLADAKIDEGNVGVSGSCGGFGAFDFFEFVDGGVDTVVYTADALCKKGLEVGEDWCGH